MIDDDDRTNLTHLHSVLEALLENKLSNALERVEANLKQWREGGLRAFDIHAELIEHTSRVGRMAKRIARAGPDVLPFILRDAFELGIINQDEFVGLLGEKPDAFATALGIDDDHAWNNQKRMNVEEMLGTGPVLIHLDTRVESVAVPAQFRGQNRLVLRFGYDLSPPIADMLVDEVGIHGTLTFNRQPFGCVIPWAAQYAVVSESDGHSMVWTEDMPDEVLADLGSTPSPASRSAESAPPSQKPATGSKKKPRASHLKLVD